MSVTTFYLIRHGDTAAIDRYLAGRAAGTPLTDAGRAQAARMVERLHHVPLTAVAASPLERTQQTAAPLAADHGIALTTVPDLNEVDFGAWTGATFAAVAGDDLWRRYNAVRSLTPPERGELMLHVQLRAVQAVLDLHAQYPDGSVAVVSHGDVIRSLLMYFLGMPIDFVHRLDVAPARISVVALYGEGPPRVLQVNGDSVP
jgi:broad specificity phosphatase PhoE